MVVVRSFPLVLSATPVTVTVWGVLQRPLPVVVKVREVGFTVAAVVAPDVTAMVTFAVGALFNTTL